jgi:ferritin-like metal-binding protein YciE
MTMPAMATLHDLMIHQLRDIYSAEKQLVQALPKMAKNANSSELQDALRSHLQETEEHVSRLEQAFEMLGVTGRGMKCKGMEGLIEEGKELLEEEIDPEVLDAGIIAAAQRIEHYEIAAYGTVCEYARIMEHDELLSLLDSTLAEEKTADQKLTTLAETGINAMAENGVLMQSDEEDDDSDEESDSSNGTGTARSGMNKSAASKQTGSRAPAKRTSQSKSKR